MARRKALTPAAIGGAVVGTLGLAVVAAALFREPARSVDKAAASSSVTPAALSSASASAIPVAQSSASASGASASASVSAAPQKPQAKTVKSSTATPTRRKLLPGGVDEAVPF